MKKFAGIFVSLIMLGIALVASSCITNGDKTEIAAPTIQVAQGTISVSFNSMSGMSYANIFRQSSTLGFLGGDNDTQNTENIGQVIPNDKENLPNSFNFFDTYTTSGTSYRYFIRYYKEGYYTYTDTSPIVLGTGVGEAVLNFNYGDSDETVPTITYNRNIKNDSYSLELNTTTIVPYILEADDFDSLYFIIDNGTIVKPFKFHDTEKDTDDGHYKVMSGAETNDLRIFLPDTFLGKKIYIKSLIGVKQTSSLKDLNDTESVTHYYYSYYWTNHYDVQLTLAETALDVSGETTTNGGTVADNHIVVPSIGDQANDAFDYNAPKRAISTSTADSFADVPLDFSPYQP